MLKNTNQEVINRIYKRKLKENKIRNITTILAVILTTFMFTTVFTMGFSMAKNLNLFALRQQGTKATIYINAPSEEEISIIKDLPHFESCGMRISAGSVATTEDKRYPLVYVDYDNFNKNMKPALGEIDGSLPNHENEIMLPTKIMEHLHISKDDLNKEVEIIVNGNKCQMKLSGWYENFSDQNNCFVSKEYINNNIEDAEESTYLCIAAKEGKNSELTEEIADDLPGLDGDRVKCLYDATEDSVSVRIIIGVFITFIAFLVVASGYLLIYNITHIAVTKDTRFYGMLKTIGASPSQIKSIVKKQTYRLALLGIPIGAFLGTFLSFIIVPLTMDMFSSGKEAALSDKPDFNVAVYVFAIVFTFITVKISLNKPVKLASNISAIEALKYQGNINENIKNYKSTDGGKIHRMAYRNVFRDKKKSRLVFASLFLGTMAFLCINTLVRCLDVDAYMANYFFYDYAIFADEEGDDNPEEIGAFEVKGAVSMEDIYEQVKAIDGISYVRLNKSAMVKLEFDFETYKPILEAKSIRDGVPVEEIAGYYTPNENGEIILEDYCSTLVSVDEVMLEKYNKQAIQKIDIGKFQNGEQCIILGAENEKGSKEMLGKTINLSNMETGKKIEIEVGAAPDDKHASPIVSGQYWRKAGEPDVILVSDKLMDELFPEAKGQIVLADARWGKDSEIAPVISRLCKENSAIIGGSGIKSIEKKDFEKSMLSLTVVGDAISLVLVLIGIVNFINVMITNVYIRSSELAILESVGMTKKQTKKMLVLEGAFYGIITLVLVGTLGSLMMYGTGIASTVIADYASIRIPYFSIGFICFAIMAICVVVPTIVYNSISKQTVIDRLR